ncbi:MAG: hypothetical protein WC527_08105 [Candidatus Margulisiibacteriota bacterium]
MMSINLVCVKAAVTKRLYTAAKNENKLPSERPAQATNPAAAAIPAPKKTLYDCTGLKGTEEEQFVPDALIKIMQQPDPNMVEAMKIVDEMSEGYTKDKTKEVVEKATPILNAVKDKDFAKARDLTDKLERGTIIYGFRSALKEYIDIKEAASKK